MSKKKKKATAPKTLTPLPARSAWARGPPQLSSIAPSPCSQSPAPSTPVLPSHFRRPSTLDLGIPIKDGVSIPRNNLGAVKQGSAVTFGSIDDVSAPISSSPATVPPTKSVDVKTFGSVPVATAQVNGNKKKRKKTSISSRASVVPPTASTSTASSVLSAATPPVRPKIDVKKMFQSPSSAPSSNPLSDTSSPSSSCLSSHPHNSQISTMPPPPTPQMHQPMWYYQYPASDQSAPPLNPPSDTSSPSTQNVGLPTQQQHQGQSSHTPPNSSQLAHSFMPFVPSNTKRPPQSNGSNGGSPPGLSPQHPRQMSNGNGPRSQGSQNDGSLAGLSSPHLVSYPHNSQTSTMHPPPPPLQMQPQIQPQMHQPMWYYERGVSGHLAEDPATISRNRAIRLLQEQEDGLTTDQKIAMISCFMGDVVAANAYISLTDPEVRQGWIFMMLMK